MNDKLYPEQGKVNRTLQSKEFDPERYGMVFCSNCNGSGKYFHGNRGVGVCQICGGFGLVRTEKRCMDDASGKQLSFGK